MSVDLIGDLSKVRLFDLVKPLVDEKKSGTVVIQGTVSAEICLEGGNIVNSRSDAVVGEDAMFAIMDLDDGRVTFNWRASPEKRTVNILTDQLMSDWTQREEAWKQIKTVISSSDTVFSVVMDSGGCDRTILEKQWGVFALCNGMRSVSDIAGRLRQSVFEVSKTICNLVEFGVLEQADNTGIPKAKPKETIDKSFFSTAETELKRVMGPIASVIMNDTLAAFEESKDTFPKDRVESFIRTLCDQIVDEQKRERFGRAIYVVWLSSLEDR